MPYDGSAWDETQPTQSTLANTIDSIFRDLKIGTQVRMSNEHNWPASQTASAAAGQHVFISLQQQTAQPTFPLVGTTTQDGIIYSSSGVGLCYCTYNTGAYNVVHLVGSGQTLNIAGAVYSATGTAGNVLVGGSGGVLGLVAPATTSGQTLISSSGANPYWGNFLGPNIAIAGTGANGTVGPYQATSDLLVTVVGSNCTLIVYSDAGANPTTPVGTYNGAVGQLFLTVNKANYWKAVCSGVSSAILQANATPIGR